MWNLKKKKKKPIKLMEKRIRFVATGGWRRGRNWRKVVERHKLPVIKKKSTRDGMYNMMTLVNTAV